MKQLITTCLLIGLSQATFAGVYDLEFQRVASYSDRENCQKFAERTARELASQSGVKIIDYGCQADEYSNKGLDAILTYQAPTRLKVTSNYVGLSVYSGAFYANYDECNKQLELQKELFNKATGLKPLAAYCMLDVSYLTQFWKTRVDGLGETQSKPGIAGLTFWGMLPDEKLVIASYQAATGSYGVSFFEAGVSRDGLGKSLVVRYYSKEPYSLDDYAMAYEKLSDCTLASSMVKTILQSTDKQAVIFCEKDLHSDRATLHASTFVETLKPTKLFHAKALTEQFTTLSACQQSSKNIEASSDIFGAICAGADNDFRIHLFSRP